MHDNPGEPQVMLQAARDLWPSPGPLDSLVATRFAMALERRLGMRVPLRAILESQSPEQLVLALTNTQEDLGVASHLIPLGDQSRRRRSSLSFSQERMAFMQALAVGSAAYHVAFGLRLRGELNAAALASAIGELSAHHEVLRLRFIPAAEGTVPVAGASMPIRMQVISAQGEDDVYTAASEFCNAPFDLERGNVGRAALIQRTRKDSLLVLVFHHIVMDQWSYEILLEELARAYARNVSGDQSASTRLDGYAGYAIWHRHWFRDHAFAKDRSYWLEQLDGASRVSFLPDFPRPDEPTFRGARIRLPLDEATWQALEAAATGEQATLSMLLFAALALLLRNHTGVPDVTIGVAAANRNHVTSESCVGTLVNTLPVRARLEGCASFNGLLRQVRQQFLDAMDHQDMPFELLVNLLQAPRQSGLSPLFGVMLNVLNTPPAIVDMPGLDVERVEIDRLGAQFDLTLTVDRRHSRSIWFEYATDLYRSVTVQRLANRYMALLTNVIQGTAQSLESLPAIALDEALVLRAWGRGAPAAPTDLTLRGMVSRAAARRADALAVQCGSESLSYSDLQRLAAQVTAGLLQAGVRPGDRVGLMLGRSARLPAAILGTLDAGAAFVPLDPDFPVMRLSYMCRDAGLALIIAEATGTPQELRDTGVQVVTMDELVVAVLPGVAPIIHGEDPAYILYTSGTTGQPKGVIVPHRALVNLLYAMRDQPGLRQEDRLLAITTLNFDISILELLLPLVAGACVVIASREQALDGHALGHLIQSQRISIMQGTPSTWYQLLESGWAGNPNLRALVGGERLPLDLAGRLQPLVGELWNMYGPTETTIWSTCAHIDLRREPAIQVGRPIAGTHIAIVDGTGKPVGIGVQGEILIGGTGVASGYQRLAELTREKFQVFPAVHPQLLYYRTGDVGRWTEAAQLECLGRLDAQIKVRGYRIEPGEIETVANEVPGVQRCIVATTGSSAQDVRLVLYAAVPDNSVAVMATLRDALRKRLPEYMIPQNLIRVAAIPLLPNGKVDLRALQALSPDPVKPTDNAPPRSEQELVLHGLWRELLHLDSIGRDQNFFEIGGHSLLAMRLVTRIREDLMIHCTLSQVFQNPTIALLGVALQRTTPYTDTSLVPLQLEGNGPPLYCICGVQLYRPLAAHLVGYAPVFATYVPMEQAAESGGQDVPSIENLAAKYVEVIREQQPQGPYRLLGFSMGGVIAYEIAQQLHSCGEVITDLVIVDSDAPGTALLARLKHFGEGLFKSMRGSASSGTALPAYLRAIRAYKARKYPGRILFVEAAHAERYSTGRDWDVLAPDLVTVRIASDHLELMAEPKVAELAGALTQNQPTTKYSSARPSVRL